MPNVFGHGVQTVDECVDTFRRHGDGVRGTYRARYVFHDGARDPYSGVTLERPPALIGNPPGMYFPWEQIFVSAASCVGSDYPMLAKHLGVPLTRVELIIEGVFDPRGEFDGLAGFQAPADATHCYLSLNVRAMLTSTASRQALERIHRRAVDLNMVLGALRGIPRTDELIVEPAASHTDAAGVL